MKRGTTRTSLVAILLLLLPTSFGMAEVYAQPSQGQPASAPPLPPVSIRLVSIPSQLPPGGSGVLIVQLVDARGNPSPARGEVNISLFSSDPEVAGVPAQATIPFGRSHVGAQLNAGGRGMAVVTAMATGFTSGTAKVTTALFNDFSIQLVPLDNPVAQGGSAELRVVLLASGRPFNSPTGVQISLAASIPGSALQNVEVPPGDSSVYATIAVPTGFILGQTSSVSVTAAAPGFTSATARLSVSAQGMNPQRIIVGPPLENLPARSEQFLSISLYNDTLAPVKGGIITASLFSSNSSVVAVRDSQVTIEGSGSATLAVYANATGTAEISAIAPGLKSVPLTVQVVRPFEPTLKLSVPPEVRAGEPYCFSVGFFEGDLPVPYGPATVYLSSSTEGVGIAPSVEVPSLGYVISSISARVAVVSNVTAVLNGVTGTTARIASVSAPVVGPVNYKVTAVSDSSPLSGIPLNMTYSGTSLAMTTGPSGGATFSAYNDSATIVTAPSSITLNNKTYFFTGWSNGAKGESVPLLAPAPTYSVTAQYFRSVVPTTYTISVVSDGQEPVAGLRLNVSGRALSGPGLTLSTDNRGMARFVLPNSSSFTVSAPQVFQRSGHTKYELLGIGNSTKDIANITARSPMAIDIRYATYFQFQVASPVGNTTGSGWYREGSTATFSVSETSVGGPLVFQRFAGWNGSLASDQPSGSTIINSPQSVTARWSTDNSLLFGAAGGAIAASALIGLFLFRLRKKTTSS